MNLSQVILGAVVTEKSMKEAGEKGYHTVIVHADASKTDIKAAFTKMYHVDICKVRIIKSPSKTRVRAKHGPQIKRKPRKKALVKVRAGGSLDLLAVKGAATTKAKAKPAAKKAAAKSSTK